jgi:hypothetical protein
MGKVIFWVIGLVWRGTGDTAADYCAFWQNKPIIQGSRLGNAKAK